MAAAFGVFLGAAGVMAAGLAAMVSTYGWTLGSTLTSPRILYSMSERGDLPAAFGHVHPRFRTPDRAILAYAGAGLAFALSGGFAANATLSAIVRLVTYGLVCASLVALRRRNDLEAPGFRLRAGGLVAALGLGFCAWLISTRTSPRRWILLAALRRGRRAVQCAPPMTLPTFRDVEEQIGKILREQGGIGALVMDFVSLSRVERGFGQAAYRALQDHIETLMSELKGSVRDGDVIVRDERFADRYVLFLGRRRDPSLPFNTADLRRLAERVETQLGPRVARLILPYLREKSAVDVGYGFLLHNPVESLDRQVRRLLDDAGASADLRRRLRERDERDALVEIIYNRKTWTAFQPIVEMESRAPMGYEGLSRGPRGSDLESPVRLFGAAARHDEGDELERACRRQIFRDWAAISAPGRLFINTVPATVRDPSFLGRGVIDYLGPNVSPQMVTLEITEKHVIENLNLYREAMHSFLDLGFTFAIDDVGAGYSGLETMANLGASYFKIDMALVRDVHQKKVSQQVVKAILDMGTGVGAIVIAEGIETAEEAEALQALGVRYAPGLLLRPAAGPHARRRAGGPLAPP